MNIIMSVHIDYFRKNKRDLNIDYFVLWRFLKPLILSLITMPLTVCLLLKNIFTTILVATLNPQSRWLLQEKSDSGC